MEKEIKDTVDLAIRLGEEMHKLTGLKSKKYIATLGVDLADITESCTRIPKMIHELEVRAEASDKEGVADMLVEIETELDHIQWHYKQGKRKLNRVADLLYGEDET